MSSLPKQMFDPNDTDELVRAWLLHAHKGRDRHDLAARRYDSRRTLLGVPAILLATAVGSSVFASLANDAPPYAKLLMGLASVSAAVLSALQTFFDYPARAERHRAAGARYKAIIRELEEVRSTAKMVDGEYLDGVRRRLDALELEAPVVASPVYDEIELRYSKVEVVRKAIPE